MNKKLLPLNRLNLNDRMYTSHSIQETIRRFEGKEAFLENQINFTGVTNLENVIGVITNLSDTGDWLTGDVKLIDSCPPDIRQMVEDDTLSIRPFGVGDMDEHRIVYNFTLGGFSITDDPA